MLTYMAICLFDLIVFGITGPGIFSVSAFSDALANDRFLADGDHFGRADGFRHARGVGAPDSARWSRGLWAESGAVLLCCLFCRAKIVFSSWPAQKRRLLSTLTGGRRDRVIESPRDTTSRALTHALKAFEGRRFPGCCPAAHCDRY